MLMDVAWSSPLRTLQFAPAAPDVALHFSSLSSSPSVPVVMSLLHKLSLELSLVYAFLRTLLLLIVLGVPCHRRPNRRSVTVMCQVSAHTSHVSPTHTPSASGKPRGVYHHALALDYTGELFHLIIQALLDLLRLFDALQELFYSLMGLLLDLLIHIYNLRL